MVLLGKALSGGGAHHADCSMRWINCTVEKT
jgi:hypothetical protein